MANDLNQLALEGTIVDEPKLIRDGFVAFTIVHDRYRFSRAKDGSSAFTQDAEYFPCKAFGKWAEAILLFRKGDRVVVRGQMHIRRQKTESTSFSNPYVDVRSIAHRLSRQTASRA